MCRRLQLMVPNFMHLHIQIYANLELQALDCDDIGTLWYAKKLDIKQQWE